MCFLVLHLFSSILLVCVKVNPARPFVRQATFLTEVQFTSEKQ